HDIGVRLAIGASPGHIAGMIVKGGSRLLLAGIALGLAGGFLTARLLARQIWHVSPFDPISFGVVSLVLLVAGLLACVWPAPREILVPGLRSAEDNQRMRPYQLNQYRELTRLPAFSDVMATGPGNVLLTGEFAPESLTGIRLTGNALNFLGVPPIAGRTIQPW